MDFERSPSLTKYTYGAKSINVHYGAVFFSYVIEIIAEDALFHHKILDAICL